MTDCYTAELVAADGEEQCPHLNDLPEKEFGLAEKLAELANGYEEAKLSPLVYRPDPSLSIALLQSALHAVYINERYTDMFGDWYVPHIRGELEPVLVTCWNEVRRVIAPIRVKREDHDPASPRCTLFLERFYPLEATGRPASCPHCGGEACPYYTE